MAPNLRCADVIGCSIVGMVRRGGRSQRATILEIHPPSTRSNSSRSCARAVAPPRRTAYIGFSDLHMLGLTSGHVRSQVQSDSGIKHAPARVDASESARTRAVSCRMGGNLPNLLRLRDFVEFAWTTCLLRAQLVMLDLGASRSGSPRADHRDARPARATAARSRGRHASGRRNRCAAGDG